jgi:hypothetical protein
MYLMNQACKDGYVTSYLQVLRVGVDFRGQNAKFVRLLNGAVDMMVVSKTNGLHWVKRLASEMYLGPCRLVVKSSRCGL